MYDQTRVDITAGAYQLRATARILRFPGWRAAYGDELATLFVPAGVSRTWLSPSQRPGTARSVWP